MKPLGRIADHTLLAKRMGQVTDVDVVAAFAEGRLTQDQWAQIVQTCRGCAWSDRCATWLSTHAQEQSAPPTCLNRARLHALRP